MKENITKSYDGSSPGNPSKTGTPLGNAIANSAMGLATAVYSLSVPAALARVITPNEFAVWSLALQISGYAAILGLGLQDAIGRNVAFYTAKDNVTARDEFVSTAFYALCTSAVLAMAGIAAVSTNIGRLFPRIPSDLRGPLSNMLLAVGAVTSLGLPFSVFNGVLVGIRRNDLVAIVASTTKLLLTAVLILTAWISQSLSWLTFWFVTLNLGSYLAMWRTCCSRQWVSIATRRFTQAAYREISRYCGMALVWQISMFVVSGLDVAIVGRFDFPYLAFYSVCVTPVIVISGSVGALFSPLIQVGATYAAHGRNQELAELLLRGTRYATIIMSLAAVIVAFFAEEIVAAWLGANYAPRSAPILRLLMIGHSLRQLTYPYTALLIAMGQQSKLLVSPIVEAVVNLLVALVSVRYYGAVGVAYAVVMGSVVRLLIDFRFNLSRTHGEEFDRRAFLVSSILWPVACFAPMALFAVGNMLDLTQGPSLVLRLSLLVTSVICLWRFAIRDNERFLALEFAGNACKHARSLVR